MDYYYNDQKECQKCEQNCNICLNQNNKCVDCTQNFILQKCKTCKKGYYQDNQKNCIQCQDGCEECTSSECINCKQGYYLNEQKQCKKCEQNCHICLNQSNKCQECTQYYILVNCNQTTTAIYNSQITPQQEQTIRSTAQITSQVAQVSSTAMTIIQRFLELPNYGLLVQGLTFQRLVYMLLVKVKLPKSIQYLIESTKDIIFKQNSYQDTYFNLKFKSVNLKYSIFYTCGQGVSIVIICESLFVLFYLLQEKVNHPKIKSVNRLIYSKLFSGLIIQYIQLSASMFVIGINSQILEFIYQDNISYYASKVIFTIHLFFFAEFINYKIYFYLNVQKIEQQEQSFAQITREKVQNETISESKLRRNFMMIFVLTQSILPPTVFILLNQNYIVICVMMIIIQIGYIASVSILMPFYSKITNIYFLIDSILWLLIYIEYFIINILSTKEDINNYFRELDKTCWAFTITVEIILLLNPIYLLVMIISKIIDLIRSKLSPKFKSSLLQSQQLFETLQKSDEYVKTKQSYSVNYNIKSVESFNMEVYRIVKQHGNSNTTLKTDQIKSLYRKYK